MLDSQGPHSVFQESILKETTREEAEDSHCDLQNLQTGNSQTVQQQGSATQKAVICPASGEFLTTEEAYLPLG